MVQSAPGPKPGVGYWVAEQETMAEPAGQAGAYPGVHPHPPGGAAGLVQLPNAAPAPGGPLATAAQVMVASAALKVVSLGVGHRRKFLASPSWEAAAGWFGRGGGGLRDLCEGRGAVL